MVIADVPVKDSIGLTSYVRAVGALMLVVALVDRVVFTCATLSPGVVNTSPHVKHQTPLSDFGIMMVISIGFVI